MSTKLNNIKTVLHQLRSNFIFLILLSMIIGGVAAFIEHSKKSVYKTYSKIFPLSINKASGNSPIDAIKSQFGISDKTDFDKIYNVKELVTSKTISHNIVAGKTDSIKYKNLAAWIIEDYNKNISLFGKLIKVNKLDSSDKIFVASSLMLKNTLIDNDPKTGFTTITTSFHEKELCKEVNMAILDELANYYIKLVTEKPRADLYKIKVLRDSLKDELYLVESAIAGFQDANQLSVKYSVNIPQAKLIRNRAEIEQLYSVTATAFQNARFKLLSESPIFQILDYPGKPYEFIESSWKKVGFLFFILSFTLLSILVNLRVIFRIILSELSKP